MNDTFSFHAPAEAFRRRIDPRWIRLGAVAAALTVALGSVAQWVVTSERAGDARLETALTALRQRADAPPPPPVELGDDAAMAAASTSLTIARDVFAQTGSFGSASTAVLAAESPALIFVDGPSAAPAIVSVHARDDVWSAAVMGEPGTCFWVKATADGMIRYGQGPECTGAAAAAADATAW
jgi:hypothetical protein